MVRNALYSLFLFLLLAPALVAAQNPTAPPARLECDPEALTGLKKAACLAQGTAEKAGFNPEATSPATLAGTIVQGLLGLLGVVFMVLVIIGGYMWMTAGGSEEQVTKAKKFIGNAAIGLLVVLGAWLFYAFIIQSILGL